ncbi:MAG: TolC family protein [Deltaproteobacteria bacterium]|nr:TolC family protein [Deltaproteobacteria bacterium]
MSLMLSLALSSAGPAQVLTLGEALELAIASHPELSVAEARLSAFAARADEARAPRLPRLSASMGYERSTSNVAARAGSVLSSLAASGTSSFDTSDYFSFGLSARQLVYDFGATSGRVASADSNLELARANAKTSRLDVELSVRTAYHAARAAKALVRVAEQTLENEVGHTDRARALVEIGARPEIDLVEALSAQADRRVELVKRRGEAETAMARLVFAIGAELESIDVIEEPIQRLEGEGSSAKVLTEQSLSVRPEVVALEQKRTALLGSLSAAQAGYGPSLSLSASFSESGAALDSLAWNAGAGLDVTWSLFEGGATTAEERALRHELASADAELVLLSQRIRLEIEEALVSVRSSSAALSAHQEARTLAEERLRLAEGRYAAGAGSSLELGDATLRLATTLADGVRLQNELATARAKLLRALGRSQ